MRNCLERNELVINDVTAVIVTYGDRWNLVKKVMQKLDDIDEIKDMVIVCNGIDYNMKAKFNDKDKLKTNLHIVSNVQNEGSAGGFNKGISEARNLSNEYIMLFDDDTYVEKNALTVLSQKILTEKISIKNNAFCFYRGNWIKKDQQNIETVRNTFFEFNLFKKKAETIDQKNTDFLNRNYVPYAGFIFSKEQLEKVKLPPKDYYLYVDDTKFTFGFLSANLQILCFTGAEIYELETSWAQAKKMPLFQAIFNAKGEEVKRGLYNIRNRSNFEKTMLESSKIKYFLNKTIYLCYVMIKYMPKNKSGLELYLKILKYIHKGSKGELGIIP